MLPGSIDDQGYNADGQRAADLMTSELGADVTVTENVPVPNQTDVYRQYAAQGYDLVIGWGGQFTDGAVAAADEFPNVKFLVVNSDASNGSNLASIDTKIEQWEFLGGFVLGRSSPRPATIGWVGGQCFPATAANLHGVEQGAKYAEPEDQVPLDVHRRLRGPDQGPAGRPGADRARRRRAQRGTSTTACSGSSRRPEGPACPFITEWVDNSQLAPEVIVSSILKSQATLRARHREDGPGRDVRRRVLQVRPAGRLGSGRVRYGPPPRRVYQEALAVQKQISAGPDPPSSTT